MDKTMSWIVNKLEEEISQLVEADTSSSKISKDSVLSEF
jgi:hypothetical protein